MRSAVALAIALAGLGAGVRGAEFESELIFPPRLKHVHSSSVVEASNGELIACWYHGSGERRANDVRIEGARKRPGESSWGPVFVMADTPGLPDCNPALFIDGRDRLWLFWIVVQGNRWEHSILKYRRADKYLGDGAPKWSWQDVIHLVPGDAFAAAVKARFDAMELDEGLWAEYAPPYSRMIVQAAGDSIKRQTGWMPRTQPLELDDGRILLPLYSDGFNISLMAISDDAGETWRPSGPIVGLGPIQPSLVRHRDGSISAFMRDSGRDPARVLHSVSKDRGETWSVAVDTDIPNPGSSLDVIDLPDGRWVMVFNDTERGRHRLALALSDDEGATWKRKRHLEVAPEGARRGSYAYPTLIRTRDGRLHVTYTHTTERGESIKHGALDVEWITSR